MATREAKMGKATLRWQPSKNGGFDGVVILNGKRGEILHHAEEERLIARLRNEAGRLHPDYFGFDGAISRFRHFFPDGFQSSANDENERGYKVRASEKLRSALSVDQAAVADSDEGVRVMSAGIQTNLLSQFEAARLNDTLRGGTSRQFLRGAAAFTQGNYDVGLGEMINAVKPHGRISWPIVTYLPFLWDYQHHMFLKPTVTVDFAQRVGHSFQHEYAAEPTSGTYLSLLDLVATTRAEISMLGPNDNIDIQSFIWVVGAYPKEDNAP